MFLHKYGYILDHFHKEFVFNNYTGCPLVMFILLGLFLV